MTKEFKIDESKTWIKLPDEVRGKSLSIRCNSTVYYATTDDDIEPEVSRGHKMDGEILKARDNGYLWVKINSAYTVATIYYETV